MKSQTWIQMANYWRRTIIDDSDLLDFPLKLLFLLIKTMTGKNRAQFSSVITMIINLSSRSIHSIRLLVCETWFGLERWDVVVEIVARWWEFYGVAPQQRLIAPCNDKMAVGLRVSTAHRKFHPLLVLPPSKTRKKEKKKSPRLMALNWF